VEEKISATYCPLFLRFSPPWSVLFPLSRRSLSDTSTGMPFSPSVRDFLAFFVESLDFLLHLGAGGCVPLHPEPHHLQQPGTGAAADGGGLTLLRLPPHRPGGGPGGSPSFPGARHAPGTSPLPPDGQPTQRSLSTAGLWRPWAAGWGRFPDTSGRRAQCGCHDAWTQPPGHGTNSLCLALQLPGTSTACLQRMGCGIRLSTLLSASDFKAIQGSVPHVS
jgi:hypothetical protein